MWECFSDCTKHQSRTCSRQKAPRKIEKVVFLTHLSALPWLACFNTSPTPWKNDLSWLKSNIWLNVVSTGRKQRLVRGSNADAVKGGVGSPIHGAPLWNLCIHLRVRDRCHVECDQIFPLSFKWGRFGDLASDYGSRCLDSRFLSDAAGLRTMAAMLVTQPATPCGYNVHGFYQSISR